MFTLKSKISPTVTLTAEFRVISYLKAKRTGGYAKLLKVERKVEGEKKFRLAAKGFQDAPDAKETILAFFARNGWTA